MCAARGLRAADIPGPGDATARAEGPTVTVVDPYLETAHRPRSRLPGRSTSSSAARRCASTAPHRLVPGDRRRRPRGLGAPRPDGGDAGAGRREAGDRRPGARGLRRAPPRGRAAARRLRRRERADAYGAYSFNEHLAAELALAHILGNFSDGQYATIGVTHVPVPEWRIQPFLSIGTGVIRIQPGGHAGRHRGADRPGRLCRNRGARVSRAALHRARRIQGVRGLHGPRRERGRNRMESRIRIFLLSLALLASGCS